jgi:hypothetical protein
VVEIPIHQPLWADLEEDERHQCLTHHLMDAVRGAGEPRNAVLTDGIRCLLVTFHGAPQQPGDRPLCACVGLEALTSLAEAASGDPSRLRPGVDLQPDPLARWVTHSGQVAPQMRQRLSLPGCTIGNENDGGAHSES